MKPQTAVPTESSRIKDCLKLGADMLISAAPLREISELFKENSVSDKIFNHYLTQKTRPTSKNSIGWSPWLGKNIVFT